MKIPELRVPNRLKADGWQSDLTHATELREQLLVGIELDAARSAAFVQIAKQYQEVHLQSCLRIDQKLERLHAFSVTLLGALAALLQISKSDVLAKLATPSAVVLIAVVAYLTFVRRSQSWPWVADWRKFMQAQPEHLQGEVAFNVSLVNAHMKCASGLEACSKWLAWHLNCATAAVCAALAWVAIATYFAVFLT